MSRIATLAYVSILILQMALIAAVLMERQSSVDRAAVEDQHHGEARDWAIEGFALGGILSGEIAAACKPTYDM